MCVPRVLPLELRNRVFTLIYSYLLLYHLFKFTCQNSTNSEPVVALSTLTFSKGMHPRYCYSLCSNFGFRNQCESILNQLLIYATNQMRRDGVEPPRPKELVYSQWSPPMLSRRVIRQIGETRGLTCSTTELSPYKIGGEGFEPPATRF